MTESAAEFPRDVRQDLLKRLRRIEGQAQGVQRMIEQGRSCGAILDQLKSIRSAAYGACLVLMKHYALECMRNAESGASQDRALDEMMDLMFRLPH